MKNVKGKFLAFSLFCLVALVMQAAQPKKEYNVIFIGNSITQGAQHPEPLLTAPPVQAASMLAKMLKAEVHYKNCGVSGATTSDFRPNPPEKGMHCFERVVKAIAELKQQYPSAPFVFSVMLGTNDSACTRTTDAPVSIELYESNLRIIMDELRKLAPGCLIVLHRPIYYSPNTFNGAMYLQEGLDRMNSYQPVLEKLIAESSDVYKGSFEAYDFFEKNHDKMCWPEKGKAGIFYLHPNVKGAKVLAKYWAKEVTKACGAYFE